MPLIKCPDCGREVSDSAENCLQCGAPISPKETGAEYVGRSVGAFVRFVLAVIVSGFTWLVLDVAVVSGIEDNMAYYIVPLVIFFAIMFAFRFVLWAIIILIGLAFIFEN